MNKVEAEVFLYQLAEKTDNREMKKALDALTGRMTSSDAKNVVVKALNHYLVLLNEGGQKCEWNVDRAVSLMDETWKVE